MKKIDRFTEIKNLVLSISRTELDTVLLQFKSQIQVSYSQSAVDLISSITHNPNIVASNALSQINASAFTKEGLGSFFMFVRNTILDSLLLDISIERPGTYNNQFRNKISSAKKILQAQILLSKGLFQEALKLLDEVRSKAIKYEHFEYLYESNYLRAIAHAHQPGLRDFSRSLLELSQSKKQSTASNNSKIIYLNSLAEAGNATKEKAAALQLAIVKLETIQETEPTANNRFHILSIRVMKETHESNFELVKTYLEEAIECVQKTPALCSVEREVDLLLELSLAQTQLNQLEEARKTLHQTSRLVKKSSFEFYIISKRLIFLDLYENRISDLKLKIKPSIKSKYFRRLPFAASQLEFFRAVLMLLSNDPKSCCKILLEEMSLEQEVSTDLFLGQTLFLFIAASELDEAFKTLKSAAKDQVKTATRILEKGVSHKRNRIIIQMLKKLNAANNPFDETLLSMQSALNNLDNKTPEARWVPYSFEIFPFQKWLKSKIENKKRTAGYLPIS